MAPVYGLRHGFQDSDCALPPRVAIEIRRGFLPNRHLTRDLELVLDLRDRFRPIEEWKKHFLKKIGFVVWKRKLPPFQGIQPEREVNLMSSSFRTDLTKYKKLCRVPPYKAP